MRVLYCNALELLRYDNALIDSLQGLEGDLPTWCDTYQFDRWSARINHEPYPLGMLVFLAASAEAFVRTHVTTVTERRMAATALALRWYAVEHDGRLPDWLAELVPKYLPEVPMDALAAHAQLGYDRDPRRPRIWSVGWDGINHGGQEKLPERGAVWNARNTDRVVRLSTVAPHTRPSDRKR